MVVQDYENKAMNLIDGAASELDEADWLAFCNTVKDYIDEKDEER